MEEEKRGSLGGVPEHHAEHSPEHHPEHHSHKSYDTLKLALVALLVVIIIVQSVMISNLKDIIGEKRLAAEEAAKPSVISLVAIKDSKCKGCFDISPLVAEIKKGNVEVSEEKDVDASSEEAKELISRYSIAKTPAIIVGGEVSKLSLAGFEAKDDALVFNAPNPPFTDVESGEIQGLVTVVQLVDKLCTKCTDFSTVIDGLKNVGVGISESSVIDYKSSQGKMLVEKYNLKVVPTMIMSSGIKFYPEIVQNWNEVGSIEKDGNYIMRNVTPPYINVDTAEVVGMVTVIYLTDSKCATCYDVDRHKQILEGRYKVYIGEEKTIDIGSKEGAALVEKYKIKGAPTMLLSEEISAYAALAAIWGQVGTVEPDGTYVFRDVSVMGGDYRNITSGEIVKFEQPEAAEAQ